MLPARATDAVSFAFTLKGPRPSACHSADTPSACILKRLPKGEGGAAGYIVALTFAEKTASISVSCT